MPTFSLNEWIELLGKFYNHHGYLTVFLGTLGENTAFLGILLPGNSLALLGAVYARLGTLNLGWVILLASLGMPSEASKPLRRLGSGRVFMDALCEIAGSATTAMPAHTACAERTRLAGWHLHL